MDTTLTWLHLSDLHCCKARTGWDAGRVLRALERDLEELTAEQELRPDFLFFTGDAAFGHLPDDGLLIAEQFEEAARFFEQIRTLCGVEHENVFLVPGNHDVDRTCITGDDTDWLEGCRQTYDRDAVHKLIRQGGGEDRWRRLMARLDAYRAFLERHGYTHLLQDRERLIYAHRRRVRGIEVAVAGLNSAWSCRGDDDHGRLWLAGDWQVASLEEQLAGAQLAIGLMHHPLSWLVAAEAPDLEPLFERAFDFHLHGHEHKAWVKPLADGSVRVAAGACYDRSDRANGYNLTRLDFDNGRGEVWLRYYEKDAGYWQKRELRGKTDADGVWHLDGLRCFARRRVPRSATGPAAAPPALAGGGERLVDKVFDALARNPILLMLAQDGFAEREVLAEIRARAAASRGAERTFHVTLPGSSEATLEQYFARLARQCGFADDVRDATDWEDALDRRLSDGERLFLMVSGFEKGSDEGRRQLGAVLRALAERHGPALSMVLSGGERLAALKYQDGRMSVLNAAERLDWPEPTTDDVLVWQRRDFPELSLERRDAEELLELCGGHPHLVCFCLNRSRRGRSRNERQALADGCDAIWQLFTPYQSKPGAHRVCEWLERDDLGREQRWIGDGLLRRGCTGRGLSRRGVGGSSGAVTWCGGSDDGCWDAGNGMDRPGGSGFRRNGRRTITAPVGRGRRETW